jgi:hypothetical protein
VGKLAVNVVAIAYDGHPSTRLRVEQYEDALREDGIQVSVLLLPQSASSGQHDSVRAVTQALATAEIVLVQRVLLGWLNRLLRASRKPVVFDLDDAVHYIRPKQVQSTEHPQTLADRGRVLYRQVVRGSKYYSSRQGLLQQMLSFSRVAIVANRFLREEVANTARSPVVVLPTCVPTDPELLKDHARRLPLTLGWVGVRDNLAHLRTLEPAFRALAARYGDGLRLHVVSSEPYESAFLPTIFTTWSAAGEGELVRTFDIGLMPLVDDRFSRGKSAFKAILCMSYGIPVVISPVGVNADIVKNGWNGFLASASDEWEGAIAKLAESDQLRARLGRNAFHTVEERFSTARGYSVLKSVLEQVARGEPFDDVPSEALAETPS